MCNFHVAYNIVTASHCVSPRLSSTQRPQWLVRPHDASARNPSTSLRIKARPYSVIWPHWPSLIFLKLAACTAILGPLFWCLLLPAMFFPQTPEQLHRSFRYLLQWLLSNEASHGHLPKNVTPLHPVFPIPCPFKFFSSLVYTLYLYLSCLVTVFTTST